MTAFSFIQTVFQLCWAQYMFFPRLKVFEYSVFCLAFILLWHRESCWQDVPSSARFWLGRTIPIREALQMTEPRPVHQQQHRQIHHQRTKRNRSRKNSRAGVLLFFFISGWRGCVRRKNIFEERTFSLRIDIWTKPCYTVFVKKLSSVAKARKMWDNIRRGYAFAIQESPSGRRPSARKAGMRFLGGWIVWLCRKLCR